MSSDTHAQHVHAAHANHGSLRDYVIGFVLSVILTVIPFWLVMGDVFASKAMTVGLVMAFGAVQMVVHMVYFLHMKRSSEGGWIVMSMLFTVVIILIALVGSLWVMYNMNTNMMPMPPEMMHHVMPSHHT